MTDLIKEIRLLEQSTERKIALAREEHERSILTAKRAAMERVAEAQQGVASERDSRIARKSQALAAAKEELLHEAQHEAERIKEQAQQNEQRAVRRILQALADRCGPRTAEARDG